MRKHSSGNGVQDAQTVALGAVTRDRQRVPWPLPGPEHSGGAGRCSIESLEPPGIISLEGVLLNSDFRRHDIAQQTKRIILR